MENPVLSTTFEVVEKAKDVKINREKIKKLAHEWMKERIEVPTWDKSKHLDINDEYTMLTYLIVLDSLNFCFWSKNPKKKWTIMYRGKKYSGYFGLSMALKRFFLEMPNQANFESLAEITFSDFEKLLRGRGELLFLKKRWEILRAVSRVMVEKYQGNPIRFVSRAQGKTSLLVDQIIAELPSFDDSVRLGGKKIYFLKRAQILPLDIWGALSGKGFGAFDDLDYVTAFPDYKLPQILRQWGIFEYSPKLAKKIDALVEVPAGSREEMEIRAATIWAVEYLKEDLANFGKKMYSFEIDWILWIKSKEIEIENPHHLTKTIFY